MKTTYCLTVISHTGSMLMYHFRDKLIVDVVESMLGDRAKLLPFLDQFNYHQCTAFVCENQSQRTDLNLFAIREYVECLRRNFPEELNEPQLFYGPLVIVQEIHEGI